jgi:hypothetical protein
VQIEAVLRLSKERNLFRIIESLDDLVHRNPKNTVVRAYLETNLFKFEPFTYFNTIPLMSIIKVEIYIHKPPYRTTSARCTHSILIYLRASRLRSSATSNT